MESIEHLVRRLIAEQFGFDIDEVKPGSRFEEDYGADSLDMAEVMLSIEETLAIEIPEERWENCPDVASVIACVEGQLNHV